MSQSNRDGFTLIELLVSVAIVGILIALLVPALSLGKGFARSISCKNHLHQMGIALQMYVHDNQDKYPYYLGPAGPSYGDATETGGRATNLVYWSSKLFPYYPLNWTNRSFQCPGYGGKVSGPYLTGAIDRLGSYAYNAFGARIDDRANEYYGLGPVLFWKDDRGNYVPAVADAQIVTPAELLAIGDSAMMLDGAPGSGLGFTTPMIGGDDFWRCDLNAWGWLYVTRHGKKYNQLLCDGHVSSMTPSLFFNPSNTAAMWNYDHQPHPELWAR